jgi:hypothetical protein
LLLFKALLFSFELTAISSELFTFLPKTLSVFLSLSMAVPITVAVVIASYSRWGIPSIVIRIRIPRSANSSILMAYT